MTAPSPPRVTPPHRPPARRHRPGRPGQGPPPVRHRHTFADLSRVPHTVAYVDGVPDRRTSHRLAAVLLGELARRLRLLGEYAQPTVRSYQDHVRSARFASHRVPTPPLPTLAIVIDGADALGLVDPDWPARLADLAALGRTAGILLVVGSGAHTVARDWDPWHRVDGLLTHRIALRVDSAEHSRAIIGEHGADQLPDTPGHGYLSTPGQPPLRFLPALTPTPSTPAGTDRHLTSLLTAHPAHHLPARPLWLPPLATPVPLGPLLDPAPAGTGALRVPVGLVDRPDLHQQLPLVLDLTDAHVAVVGRTGSGRSTTLTTLLTALAHHHPPTRWPERPASPRRPT